MTHVRVPSNVMDADIQRRLNQMYSKQDMQDNKKVAMGYVLLEHTEQHCTVLAISSSAISLDLNMCQQMMRECRNEDQYATIFLQTLEDLNEMNEVQVSNKSYRIKQGTPKVHVQQQPETWELLASGGTQ